MSWKKALLVALVVLLVLIGLPLLMPAMEGAATCADCGPVVMAGPTCVLAAVLAGCALAIALLSQLIRARRDELLDLLRAALFDRPPQLA